MHTYIYIYLGVTRKILGKFYDYRRFSSFIHIYFYNEITFSRYVDKVIVNCRLTNFEQTMRVAAKTSLEFRNLQITY